ncbi:DUF4297 domain-containing protein [Roseomonas terrae]|uniref:DUF4297 domain-containing protein n=1 Tax=Neoroseomonas terrae TaxID=424799 RepID=A0ABS5ECF3_9PROT|nr:dsDNA nuclease domain-containing protein [Neoroseomonas terrae]MBR0648712.1 DUF4297 domain-containing protein [Neoroseomonas terrae]
MSSLSSVMLMAQPREKAGPRTGARFAFQVHASLAKLLELHQNGVDYRALFDHFDDLAILVGSNEPTSIEFIQIKGRETGPWKTAPLCKAEGANPRTTIGKMYHHTIAFADMLVATVFLTNAYFEFDLATGKLSSPDHAVLAYPDLGPKAKKAFAKALEQDFPSPRAPDESSIVRFERTRVPLPGYDTYLRGRLVEFLDEGAAGSVNAVYKTLITEVTAKTNDTTECAQLVELYANKSLCRDDLEKVFCEAQTRRNILDDWAVIDSELQAASRSSLDRIRLKTAVTLYQRNRSKRLPAIDELHSTLRAAAGVAACSLSKVLDMLGAAAELSAQVDPSFRAKYDDWTWEAALLVEAFDAVNGQ